MTTKSYWQMYISLVIRQRQIIMTSYHYKICLFLSLVWIWSSRNVCAVKVFTVITARLFHIAKDMWEFHEQKPHSLDSLENHNTTKSTCKEIMLFFLLTVNTGNNP